MPPKSDLVYPSLDNFVEVIESASESVVEKSIVETGEPKTARKEDGAPIIEDWVSKSKKEVVSKIKIVKIFNKPSFAKINFVKSTKQLEAEKKFKVIVFGFVGGCELDTTHLGFVFDLLYHSIVSSLYLTNCVFGSDGVRDRNLGLFSGMDKAKSTRKTVKTGQTRTQKQKSAQKARKSLMKKMYCLVVTDDFSIENLIDLKVKVIRCDNGTEFKNRVMNQFCEMKGIKREFSVARTPQQNRVAKRKNRTLIEAARTMLADSKLPTTFWAEAVNTACRKPALSFMRPFGCPVTILNTIDHLGEEEKKDAEDLGMKIFRMKKSSDSEVHNDKPCTKSCLKNYETLKKQYDDLLAKLHQTKFKASTYKRGLDTVEAQLVTYRKNEGNPETYLKDSVRLNSPEDKKNLQAAWFKVARIVASASLIRVMRWQKRNGICDAKLFHDAPDALAPLHNNVMLASNAMDAIETLA
ncbi:putative ribonuclease H-like domain-containing protein [Tanacetum coccineum]|uniref:Ribonuclease H-like domain-containing protein n=1 Tax=Tanacetum coccineum TaxID=301880 RepID=A0ABQ5F2B8_9ASTR